MAASTFLGDDSGSKKPASGTAPSMDVPVKKNRRGRPKGSKNKKVHVVAHDRDFPVDSSSALPAPVEPVVQPAAPAPIFPIGEAPAAVPSSSTSSQSSLSASSAESAIEKAASEGEFKPPGLETVVPVVVAEPLDSWMNEPAPSRAVTAASFDPWRIS